MRAAHAAQASGQNETPMQIIVEMAFGDARKDFVGSLDDALRADILPVARGEAAPADEIPLFQGVEIFRRRPLPDHVAIGHDDQRRLHMGAQHSDRFAGLDDEGLILVHRFEHAHDRIVRGPVARGTSQRGIDDEVRRIFAHGKHILEQA